MRYLMVALVLAAVSLGVPVVSGAATGAGRGVDIELTPDQAGYWVLDNYGRVSAFGPAPYLGGSPTLAATEEAVSLAATSTGGGYYMLGSDGGIFNFGVSQFHGSIPGIAAAVALPAGGEVRAVTVAADRSGYSMLGGSGVIWPFGTLATNLPTHTSVDVAVPANPGNTKNCSDFASRSEAQSWYDRHSPFYGEACEGLGTFNLIGAGTHAVGSDIQPGTYRTRSNRPSCYWERLSGFSGPSADRITNDLIHVSAIVTIKPGDAGFTSDGDCGTWTTDLSPITSSLTANFAGGTYQVGTDVAAGTWRAPGGDGCYWERLSGYSGESSDPITNDLFDFSQVITLRPTDVGFSPTEIAAPGNPAAARAATGSASRVSRVTHWTESRTTWSTHRPSSPSRPATLVSKPTTTAGPGPRSGSDLMSAALHPRRR
jgi:hypothetical protein